MEMVDTAGHVHPTEPNVSMVNNAAVVANILELTSSVIFNIVNKDTSESLKSDTPSKQVVINIITNRLKEKILN